MIISHVREEVLKLMPRCLMSRRLLDPEGCDTVWSETAWTGDWHDDTRKRIENIWCATNKDTGRWHRIMIVKIIVLKTQVNIELGTWNASPMRRDIVRLKEKTPEQVVDEALTLFYENTQRMLRAISALKEAVK